MKNREVVCASCRQPKFRLSPRKSKLKPDQTLLMCETCIKQRLEPRWIVIMMGRDRGADYVKEFIRPKRYLGEPIMLEDLF